MIISNTPCVIKPEINNEFVVTKIAHWRWWWCCNARLTRCEPPCETPSPLPCHFFFFFPLFLAILIILCLFFIKQTSIWSIIFFPTPWHYLVVEISDFPNILTPSDEGKNANAIPSLTLAWERVSTRNSIIKEIIEVSFFFTHEKLGTSYWDIFLTHGVR